MRSQQHVHTHLQPHWLLGCDLQAWIITRQTMALYA